VAATSASPVPSPGTEESGERHYIVFAPTTRPLGRESASTAADFQKFADNEVHYLDLVVRIADPDRLHDNPDLDFWLRVRVYPGRHTLNRTGEVELTFSGDAYLLNPDGTEQDVKYTCSGSIEVVDRPVGSRIGELALFTEE